MTAERPWMLSTRRRRWLILGAACLASWLLVSAAVAHRLTRRRFAPFAEPVPTVAWGRLEEHRLTTSDGQRLGAWYEEGRADAPSVLLLHGNKGTRSHCLRRAEVLAEEGGCSVLLVSLRAHGDSTGEVNDVGYSARHDVVAAVDFLQARRPGKPVIVFGVSLGAAAAAFAAEELGDRVQGYILESPYQDLKTAVWNRTEAYLPPVLDRAAYLGLRIAALAIVPDLDAIAPAKAVERIPATTPVLILAGGSDDLARPAEARALFDRVRSHSRLEFFSEANHGNLPAVEPARYRRLILDFCGGPGARRLD